MNEAGFFEGRNFAITHRWARGRYNQLPSLAAELVERKVAVIAASGKTAVMAAKAATSTIPITFLIGEDPIRLGLVAGFHRPAGNANGVTILSLALGLQRLGLLREMLARAANVAVLINPARRRKRDSISLAFTAAGVSSNGIGTLVRREQLPLLGEYAGPRTPTERNLTEIWAEELSMDMVGITDNYEDLGGDSLLAASIFASIETTFGVDIPMYSLVDAPTIEQSARQIDCLRRDGG